MPTYDSTCPITPMIEIVTTGDCNQPADNVSYDSVSSEWLPDAGDYLINTNCGAWITTDGLSVTIDTDNGGFTVGLE